MSKSRVEAFNDWITHSRAGQVYIYYTGFLAVDRGTIMDWGNGENPVFIANGDIHDLGKTAIEAWEANRIHLFQRKIHDREYQYIAMKRRDGGRHW